MSHFLPKGSKSRNGAHSYINYVFIAFCFYLYDSNRSSTSGTTSGTSSSLCFVHHLDIREHNGRKYSPKFTRCSSHHRINNHVKVGLAVGLVMGYWTIPEPPRIRTGQRQCPDFPHTTTRRFFSHPEARICHSLRWQWTLSLGMYSILIDDVQEYICI